MDKAKNTTCQQSLLFSMFKCKKTCCSLHGFLNQNKKKSSNQCQTWEVLPLQQQGEPSLLYPSPPTPRPNVPVAKAKGDDLPPPPPPNYPPPKAKSSEGGGSGAGKGAGASPVITIDDPSSGGPSSGGPSSGGPPIQVPPVADDPLKAAGPCGPPPLPNRPKRPVDQMMASSSAGISGGCSQASQSKKYLAPTSKGGGGTPVGRLQRQRWWFQRLQGVRVIK